MQKVLSISLYSAPIILMIGLIPLIRDDYVLTAVYIVIIAVSLKLITAKRNDLVVLIFGFFAMIVSEYIFISTGAETFVRNSLFGLMPLWLPFLWSYGFVAIKRAMAVLGTDR